MYGDCITRFREKSSKSDKCNAPNDLHPLLVGDFEPDVRPFTWPKRKRAKIAKPVKQLELFEDLGEL